VKETKYLFILHDTLCLASSSVQQSQLEACQTGNYGYYIKLLDTVPARCPFDKTLPYLAIIYICILWVLYFLEIQLMHL